MVGGRALSAVVIASAIGALSQRNLWPVVFILIGVLALLTIPLVFTVSEPRVRPAEKRFSRAAFSSFWNLAFLLFIILGLVYPLALYSSNGMIGAFLNEDLGINLGQVGLYISVFGLGTIAGALAGGTLMKRVGRRNGVLSALLLTSAVTFCLAAVPSALVAWVVVFLFGVAFGYYETVYMAMDFSDPRIAAFMFSIIMAFGNIGIGAGAPVAGILVDAVGFRLMFVVFAVVNLLSLPLVFAVFHLRKTCGSRGRPALA